jgi:hypothetical protein
MGREGRQHGIIPLPCLANRRLLRCVRIPPRAPCQQRGGRCPIQDRLNPAGYPTRRCPGTSAGAVHHTFAGFRLPIRSRQLGGFSAEPGGFSAEPGGFSGESGGFSAKSGGFSAEPEGSSAEPGGSSAKPEGFSAEPGSSQAGDHGGRRV